MKIVDKRKFFRSTGITISLLVLFILLLMKTTSFSHTDTNYKNIQVVTGDSLWEIAKYEKSINPYFEEKDIRDIMDEIKYLNHLNTSNLNVGKKLIIPTI